MVESKCRKCMCHTRVLLWKRCWKKLAWHLNVTSNSMLSRHNEVRRQKQCKLVWIMNSTTEFFFKYLHIFTDVNSFWNGCYEWCSYVRFFSWTVLTLRSLTAFVFFAFCILKNSTSNILGVLFCIINKIFHAYNEQDKNDQYRCRRHFDLC